MKEKLTCERCGTRPATVTIAQVINDEVTERHLCAECAAIEGFKFSFQFPDVFSSIQKAFADLLKELFGEGGFPETPACPKCSSTFEDIAARGGKFGCSECYNYFREEARRIARGYHGTSKHRGMSPAGLVEEVDVNAQIKMLQRKLDRLVAQEKYEEAAKVRDELNELLKQKGEKSDR